MTERDVVGHLQAAAKELIAAARDVLDAADEVVSDRIRLMTLLIGKPRRPTRSCESGPPPVERIKIEGREKP